MQPDRGHGQTWASLQPSENQPAVKAVRETSSGWASLKCLRSASTTRLCRTENSSEVDDGQHFGTRNINGSQTNGQGSRRKRKSGTVLSPLSAPAIHGSRRQGPPVA